MEKPDNWFAIAKMPEKHLKKRKEKDLHIYFKISLEDSFQFLLVQINELVSP